jgi:hypothetical protein
MANMAQILKQTIAHINHRCRKLAAGENQAKMAAWHGTMMSPEKKRRGAMAERWTVAL